MSKDTLSWHADDYETESERKASFDKFMNDFRNFIHDEKMVSLDEYKEQVSSFFKTVKEKLLIDCEDNEVYTVQNSFRNDIASEYGADVYSSVFKKYENVEELIYRAEDNLEGNFEDSDEYLGDFCYWNITKYRLRNNDEYEMVFSVYQTFLNGYLEIYFNSDMVGAFTPIEKEVYNDWLRLSGIYSKERVTIKFPYEKGDILKISGYPYQNNSQYYICYDENGNAISRDYFDRLCVKRLFSYCDVVRYGIFVPCYLEKVDSCEDRALCSIRKMILSSDDNEIKNLVKMLHHSLEDDFEAYDKRVQEIEQHFLNGGIVMIIFNCLSKGLVKIDGNFSVSTIIKEVRFHQDSKECTLPEIEYLDLLKKGATVKYPCEIGDLIITTSSSRHIFQDITLSIDNSVYLTDEILDCLISNIKDECIVINLDCPNETSGTEFFCNGNLIVDKI